MGWGGEGEGGTEREEEGGHKVFISSGHDEYWSGGQRRVIERAREKGIFIVKMSAWKNVHEIFISILPPVPLLGMHLMFLSGNEMFWKIRWEGLKNHVKEKKIVYSEENDEFSFFFSLFFFFSFFVCAHVLSFSYFFSFLLPPS